MTEAKKITAATRSNPATMTRARERAIGSGSLAHKLDNEDRRRYRRRQVHQLAHDRVRGRIDHRDGYRGRQPGNNRRAFCGGAVVYAAGAMLCARVAVRKDSKPPNVSRAQSLMLPRPWPFASPPAQRPRPLVGKTGGSGARRLPRQNLDVKRFPRQNVGVSAPDNTRLSPGKTHRYDLVRSHPRQSCAALADHRYEFPGGRRPRRAALPSTSKASSCTTRNSTRGELLPIPGA